MMQPTFINAAIALVVIVGAIVGLAQLVRRFGLAGPVQQRWTAEPKAGRRRSYRIDRLRNLSIIELDGRQFAVLTGGRSDQLLALPAIREGDEA